MPANVNRLNNRRKLKRVLSPVRTDIADRLSEKQNGKKVLRYLPGGRAYLKGVTIAKLHARRISEIRKKSLGLIGDLKRIKPAVIELLLERESTAKGNYSAASEHNARFNSIISKPFDEVVNAVTKKTGLSREQVLNAHYDHIAKRSNSLINTSIFAEDLERLSVALSYRNYLDKLANDVMRGSSLQEKGGRIDLTKDSSLFLSLERIRQELKTERIKARR